MGKWEVPESSTQVLDARDGGNARIGALLPASTLAGGLAHAQVFDRGSNFCERTPRATITGFAWTRDRGLTWRVLVDSMRAYMAPESRSRTTP